MTFQEFLSSIGFQSEFSFWSLIIFLTSIGIEIIPSFKWNPWTSLIKWIGSAFNSKIDSKMDSLRGELKVLDMKIDHVQKELDKHVADSKTKELEDTRRDILDFCNSCMNRRRHTKEQFKFVIKQCDNYEAYIEKNNLKNGEIEDAINEIRRLHTKCIQENDFLKEGEDPEELMRKSLIDDVMGELHKLYDDCPARRRKNEPTADDVLRRAKTAKANRTAKTVKIKETKTDNKGEAEA